MPARWRAKKIKGRAGRFLFGDRGKNLEFCSNSKQLDALTPFHSFQRYRMNIVILGSGNVATVLGRMFRQAGHHISQVWSRNTEAASRLAYEWDTESTNYLSLIHPRADVYLLAVSDNAIAEVAANLSLPGKVVAHTAASIPGAVLAPVTKHYGVFYPLQSLRKEQMVLPSVPVYYDAADDIASGRLQQLAASISSVAPVPAGDELRLKLHLAAVMVNNFVNHLLFLTEQYCQREGIAFEQFRPLVEETIERLRYMSPASAQTGPAIRFDQVTLDRHLHLLESWPELKELYLMMTKSIQKTHA